MADEVFFGKYRLVERVAVGGMAEVFRAFLLGAEGFSRELIVKRILPDIADDKNFVAMFIDEARIASNLQHPNIVQIFDFDCIDDTYYLAMEYVKGRDLAFVLRRAVSAGARMPEDVALFVIHELLEALRYAHEKKAAGGAPLNIVHRDVTPHNLLLSFEGQVKLGDFGIAKAATRFSKTKTGALKGKYPYLAPEYVDKQQFDQRSDLYSAGAVFYEVLAGRRPFGGASDLDLLRDIVAGNYRSPRAVVPHIPAALEALVSRSMSLDPADRFQSAAAFLEAVKEICHARRVELSPDRLATWLNELMPREAEAIHLADVPTTTSSPAGEVASAGERSEAREERAERPFRSLDDTRPGPLSAPRAEIVDSGDQSGTQTGDPSEAGVDDTALLQPNQPKPKSKIWIAFLLLLVVGIVALYFFARPPPKVTVLWRMIPAQEEWFRKNVLVPYAEEHGVQLEIKRFRAVKDSAEDLSLTPETSLIKVHQTMLRPMAEAGLIQPLDAYLIDRGREEELNDLIAQFDPVAIDLGRVSDLVSKPLYGIPRKLETWCLVYRKKEVARAVASWQEVRPELEQDLVRLAGHGLPKDYALEPDPNAWDRYDLLVVSYYFARTPAGGRIAPRSMMRTYPYLGTYSSLLNTLATLTEEGKLLIEPNEAMVDLFQWEAVFRELSLYDDRMFDKNEIVTGRAVRSAFLKGEIFITRMHSLGFRLLHDAKEQGQTLEDPADIAAAVIPLGVSFDLDETEQPALQGTRRIAVGGWYWALPKKAPHPEEGYRLARHFSSRSVHESEAEAFLIQPVRTDVVLTKSSDPFTARVAETFDEQMALNAGRRFPVVPSAQELDRNITRLVKAWWEIIADRRYLSKGQISRTRIAEELERRL